MYYVSPNYKTKRDLRDAIDKGLRVGVFAIGPFFSNIPTGEVKVIGPNFPERKKWKANVKVDRGKIVEVLR